MSQRGSKIFYSKNPLFVPHLKTFFSKSSKSKINLEGRTKLKDCIMKETL
jgi:hypothetical protein